MQSELQVMFGAWNCSALKKLKEILFAITLG